MKRDKKGKLIYDEIREFVEELTEPAKKGSYISRECLLNFTKEYLSNFKSKDYKNSEEGETVPFVFMAPEPCWLSIKQIKLGEKCNIVNSNFTKTLDWAMSEAIKKGEFNLD